MSEQPLKDQVCRLYYERVPGTRANFVEHSSKEAAQMVAQMAKDAVAAAKADASRAPRPRASLENFFLSAGHVKTVEGFCLPAMQQLPSFEFLSGKSSIVCFHLHPCLQNLRESEWGLSSPCIRRPAF